MKLLALLLVIYMTATVTYSKNHLRSNSYKAATLEHEIRPYKNKTPLETMLDNVRVYTDAASRAGQMGADILVFPEYGIVGLEDFNLGEEEMSFFIFLPDEAVGNQWIPCFSPRRYSYGNGNYKVLELLSCAALNNSIVLLANLLTKEPCDPKMTPTCPDVGFYRFNTNIIFGKNGALLARYHKRHLFGEPNLNPAPEPEFVIVDVGFVTFGTFTCQDVMYADPAVDYVTKYGIKNLMFATAWMGEFPFLSTPQVFSRMARGLGINLIASNPYYPSLSRLGSGIYSSVKGAANESYDLAVHGRLLVAELPVDPLPVPKIIFDCSPSWRNHSLPFNMTSSGFATNYLSDKPSSAPVPPTYLVWYQRLGNFSRLFLEVSSGCLTLCSGDLCCQLEYSYRNPDNDLYVFAILNGAHPLGFTYVHAQICSVLRCESRDIESCGRIPLKSTSAVFDRLSIQGSFATETIFPSIIGTDLQSVEDSSWEFERGKCVGKNSEFKHGGRITLTSIPSKPIMVASVYGRVYERDPD